MPVFPLPPTVPAIVRYAQHCAGLDLSSGSLRVDAAGALRHFNLNRKEVFAALL